MWHIIKFEFKQFLADYRFWMLTVILVFLTGFSLHQGEQRVTAQWQTIENRKEAERTFYQGKLNEVIVLEAGELEVELWFQDPTNPLVLAEFGQSGKHVFLEPQPFSILAVGQSDILPYYGLVKMNQIQVLRDNSLENPFLQSVGNFDFAFVLVWLIPLIVISVGYNMISSEKEQGTYNLIMSMPVTYQQILFAKISFRFLMVCLPLLLTIFVLLQFYNVDVISFDGLTLFAAVLLYTGFWFGLCYLVNQLNTSSAANAVSLTGLWILFLLIIPATLNLLAVTLHPVPSRVVWTNEERRIQQSVEAERDQIVEAYFTEHPEEVIEGETPAFYTVWNNRLIVAQNVHDRRIEAQVVFESARDAQQNFISNLRFLSPPIWTQAWLEKFAGTSAERLRTLPEKLADFQAEWNSFFLPRFKQLDFLSSEDFETIPSPN
jgi:ABC-2 type transport system permease protein